MPKKNLTDKQIDDFIYAINNGWAVNQAAKIAGFNWSNYKYKLYANAKCKAVLDNYNMNNNRSVCIRHQERIDTAKKAKTARQLLKQDESMKTKPVKIEFTLPRGKT